MGHNEIFFNKINHEFKCKKSLRSKIYVIICSKIKNEKRKQNHPINLCNYTTFSVIIY